MTSSMSSYPQRGRRLVTEDRFAAIGPSDAGCLDGTLPLESGPTLYPPFSQTSAPG